MRFISVNEQGTFRRRAFTLLELLVTITVIAALLSLILPAWTSLKRSRSRQAALAITMDSLERARTAAITGKREVWVVFRHRAVTAPGSDAPDAIRIMESEGKGVSPMTVWQPLPAGTAFEPRPATLMAEAPPGEILTAALAGKAPENSSFGSIMFRGSGRVGFPRPGGNGLSLCIGESSGSHATSLLISRATGRACRE